METPMYLLLLLVIGLVAGLMWWHRNRTASRAQQLEDARAEARRWYERLGGQVFALSGSAPAVRQALADAGERYNAAGAQISQARTVYQCELARETALEGLLYVRAARVALDMDPGPDLPQLAAARGTGALTVRREVEVEGRTYKAGPDPSDDTPHYYPGGRMRGRRIPAGWYSEPLWNPGTAGIAGASASLLVFTALLAPGFGDPGHGGFGHGYYQGGPYGSEAGIGDYTYHSHHTEVGDGGFGDAGGFDGLDAGAFGGGDAGF
jgi:hypothetical protein